MTYLSSLLLKLTIANYNYRALKSQKASEQCVLILSGLKVSRQDLPKVSSSQPAIWLRFVLSGKIFFKKWWFSVNLVCELSNLSCLLARKPTVNEMLEFKRVKHRGYVYSNGSLIPSKHLCRFDAFQLLVLSVLLCINASICHTHFIRLIAP